MYASVLSALLFGIVPLGSVSGNSSLALDTLHIAPPVSDVAIHQRLSSSGVLILDAQTGQQLYGQHITTKRPMASLTKLMTALLIVENHDLDELVKIPQNIAEVPGSTAHLPPGKFYTVNELLSALLINSANDAAYTLALYHSGSTQEFVKEMNERAVALGMHDTQYANPTGLDSISQWTTPKDLAWITMAAMRHPEIKKRMSRSSEIITSNTGQSTTLWHTHDLLHADEHVIAGKTGTTPMARECLISLVEQNGRQYVVILLKSLKRYGDLKTIMAALNEQQPGPILARPKTPTPVADTAYPDSVAASLQ